MIGDASGAPMTVVAVPSGAVRDVLTKLKGEHPLIVLASKGVEVTTGMLLADVVREVHPGSQVAVISGPNLAGEIVRGIPTAAVAASLDPGSADRVRSAFMCSTFRVYASSDVVGVEVAGALKNVLAIGGGITDGLGFGNNTKGALLARGLKEMITFGLALGGNLETFIGIAGVGDLFATATSNLSRNYRVGMAIGEGKETHQILQELGQVAEGVTTAEAVARIAREKQLQLPIFEAIDGVLRGKLYARGTVSMLMERMTRDEGFDFLRQTAPQA
jgi:glycerol-3-phosphate dehydrogenase (NAD(P)+)